MESLTKRTLYIMLLSLLSPAFIFGQTFREFFKQKQTQRTYLLEHIVALQGYAGLARRGYRVVQKGLYTIQGLSSGELSLHKLFFSRQQQLNGSLTYAEITAAILDMQERTLQLLKYLVYPDDAPPGESEHIKRIKANLIRAIERDRKRLALISSAGTLTMGDAGRMENLATLHQKTMEKMAFTARLSTELQIWAERKRNARFSQHILKKWYEASH